MTQTKRFLTKPLIGLFILSCFGAWGEAQVKQKRPEVPYVPTPEDVVAEMLKMADVGENDILYDLGCGDGRIVITAAKELGCRGVGVDIDPVRIQESRINAGNAGVLDRVKFIQNDLFEVDISEASVVTLYLLSRVNLRLRPKLFRELKPGTRVVSHDFSMGEWEPERTSVIEEKVDYVPFQDSRFIDDYWNKHTVYFWTIPTNVSGSWGWTVPSLAGDIPFRLEIDQTFQKIRGKAFLGSTSIPLEIKNGEIIGDRLEFMLEGKVRSGKEKIHFSGIAKNHRVLGFVRVEGKPDFEAKWEAKRDPSTRKNIEE